MVGKSLSHYKIVEKLGRGGMGVVYRAHDTDLGRDVAIKVQSSYLPSDHAARVRFKQEARLASGLEHPNICTIHQIGETQNGELYIVMPLYKGQSLEDRLEEGPLSVDEAVSITRQVVDGLANVHEAGIVHRDIKPANIMLVGDRALVMDFGVAKLLQSARGLTEVGTAVGTLVYMSPEQARGEGVDHRTDLWSLGVVLYRMLTGKTPFAGGYGAAIAYSILNEDPDPVELLVADLPEKVSTLVRDLLEKNVGDRPQSGAEVCERLEMQNVPEAKSATVRKMQANPVVRWRMVVPMVTLLTIGLWWILRPSEVAVVTPGADVVAAFPFNVRGSGPYAELDIATLLYHKLDGVGDITMADPNAVIGYVQRNPDLILDPETAVSVAATMGARRFILGSIVTAGTDVVIRAALYEDTDLVAEAESNFSGDESVMPAIDDLAEDLVEPILELPEEGIGLLSEVTTESFEALRHYLQAEAYLRRGDPTAAEDESRRALAVDSTFAAGWYLHAKILDARGGSGPEPSTVRRRMETYADEASPRLRSLIWAWVAYWESRPLDAEAGYRALLAKNPKDVDAMAGLLEVLHHHSGRLGDRTPEAGSIEVLDLSERIAAIRPRNSEQIQHVAYYNALNARLHGYEHAIDRLVGSIAGIGLQPDGSVNWNQTLGGMTDLSQTLLRWYAIGSSDSVASADAAAILSAGIAESGIRFGVHYMWANEVFDRDKALIMRNLVPDSSDGFFRFVRSFFEEAGGELEAWTRFFEVQGPPGSSSEYIVMTEFATWPYLLPPPDSTLANVEDALIAWTPGVERDIIFRHYLIGLVRFHRNDIEGVAASLDSMLATGSTDYYFRSLSRELEGYLFLTDEAYDEAIRAFADAATVGDSPNSLRAPLTGRPFPAWYRAYALRAQGRTVEAHGWMMPFGFESWRSVGPIFFTRARWYDEDGETENAIRFYTLFLDQWRDADPKFQPFLKEAHERLETLLTARIGENGN